MARIITEPWDAQDILLMPAGDMSNSFPTSPVIDFPAGFQASNSYRGFVISPALTQSWDGFFMYINGHNDGANNSSFYLLANSATVQIYLTFDQLSGLLNLYKGGTLAGAPVFLDKTGSTLLGTGTHPLAQGSHYHIQVGYDSGAGTVEIRVDGTTDINVAGVTGIAGYLQTYFRSVQASSQQQYYFDSYYKNDSTGGVEDTWGGVIRMVSQVPIADGNYTAWSKEPNSGDLYTHIDETPYNGDTDYLYSSTNNQKFSVDPGAHGLTAPADIKAISARWVCRKVSSGQVKPFFRVAAADYSMASAQDLGTDYMVVMDRRRVNPATTAAWLLTDTFEVGLEAII